METLSIWFKHAMDNEMSPAFNYVFTENIISLFVMLRFCCCGLRIKQDIIRIIGIAIQIKNNAKPIRLI